MRILLVSDLDPLCVLGGGERLLAGHAAALAESGHRVLVCSGVDGNGAVEQGEFSVERIGRRPLTFARAARLVAEFRPQVVVGYQPACALGAFWGARRRGIPTIYVFCSSWPEEYRTRRTLPRRSGILLRLVLERSCLRRSDRVVVLSEYSADEVRRMHSRLPLSIRIVPGGVDPVRFSPNGSRDGARRRLGLAVRGPLLLTVRNLAPRMGLENLIAAMPRILAAAPEAHLVIAGEGPMREHLEARARDLGTTGRITFAGRVPEEQLPDYYRAADLAVLPTREMEGFGLMTVEALACGTPVVGTPVGATPEILSPIDPALVTADATPDAIAARIVPLLREAAPDLGDRARRHVLQRYTWEAAAAGLESVIGEVIR